MTFNVLAIHHVRQTANVTILSETANAIKVTEKRTASAGSVGALVTIRVVKVNWLRLRIPLA